MADNNVAAESGSQQEILNQRFTEGNALKDEGRHIEALQKYDQLLEYIKSIGGTDLPSSPYIKQQQAVSREIGIICNILAMAHLHTEDYKMCQELLKKAELYTEVGNERIRAITFNNYACLFRKTKKLRNALQYLEKALEIEYQCLNTSEQSKDLNVEQSLVISNPCEIHLNICAILSQMEKHELALHHAMKALILIQDELGERLDSISDGDPKTNPQVLDRFNVLICALHNIAVEHEFLKQYTVSLTYYQKSRDFAVQTLGSTHAMTQKMDNVYFEAAEKIQRILERQYQRKIMSGTNIRKASQISMEAMKNKTKDIKDIINSGLAQMDIENTYQEQMKGMTSPRGAN